MVVWALFLMGRFCEGKGYDKGRWGEVGWGVLMGWVGLVGGREGWMDGVDLGIGNLGISEGEDCLSVEKGGGGWGEEGRKGRRCVDGMGRGAGRMFWDGTGWDGRGRGRVGDGGGMCERLIEWWMKRGGEDGVAWVR